MFEKILIPLDGSDLSERALPYAKALAARASGRLFLVRAGEVHRPPGISQTAAQVKVVADAERAMTSVCQQLTAEGATAEWHFYYGQPVKGICEEVAICAADSIVMYTHGRSETGKMLFGSVAKGLVQNAPVPVLLISPHCERPWPASAGGRVLVPLDGSPQAEAALEPAIELAQTFAGGLVLGALVQPTYAGYGAEAYPAFELDEELLRLDKYLASVAATVQQRGIACTTVTDIAGPAEAITELARQADIVAITMASHGRSGLARLALGSVAAQVVHAAAAPVLVVRPAALAAHGRQPLREALSV